MGKNSQNKSLKRREGNKERRSIGGKDEEREDNSLVVNKKCCDRGDTGLKIGTQVNIDMLI